MQTDSLADRIRVVATNNHVPGLIFEVSPERLRKHLLERAVYHVGKAEVKDAEIPKLEQLVSDLEAAVDRIKGVSGGPSTQANLAASLKSMSARNYNFQGDDEAKALEQQIEALRNDVKDHQNKAATFRFLAESVWDAIYALTWEDLGRLELAR